MKKYSTLNKYFNRTPRGFLFVFFLFNAIPTAINIIGAIISFDPILLVGTAVSVVFTAFVFYLYYNQLTLKKARLGKHLKKHYNLEGEQLVAALDSIENEINAPLYSDATNKRKFNAFFVTQNWLVGTDGIMLLRANACRRDNIKSIETNYLVRSKNGFTMYYYVLQVTENDGYVHRFYLRSEENRDMAYDFLMNSSNSATA